MIKVNKGLKLLINILIHNFYLFINLEIVSYKQFNFNIKNLVKLVLELRNKLRLFIWYNRIRGSIKLVNIINKYSNHIFNSNSLIVKNKDKSFSKLVYKDNNIIISVFVFCKFF